MCIKEVHSGRNKGKINGIARFADFILRHSCNGTSATKVKVQIILISHNFYTVHSCRHDIVLVYVNGKLQELGKKLKKDCTLHFVTTGETIGNLTYRRGVSFLLVKAVYDTIGHDKIEQVRIHFSVDKGYYCTIKGDQKLDQELLARIEERMHEMADMDLSIRKRSVHTDEAVEMFRKYGMKDKERLFRYRRVSTVNIYSINEFEDYYYGYMVPSTGYLKYFKLYLYDEGFVVQMPEAAEPEKIPPFQPQNKLFHVLKESTRGGDMLGIETVGALNDYVTGGSANPKELLLVQEAMQEKKIAQIAEQIAGNPQKKFVLIAGPSSSGKTTFSRRLSIQLRVSGLVPHPISVDDYFKNRVDTPLDAEGKPNYECLEALDVELFNHDLKKLLAGERIELPTFNFKTGKREYNGHYMQLGEQDILVIEGIHCLNDRIRKLLPSSSLMGICLMRPHRKHGIQKQYTLICPFFQIAVVWNFTPQIILQFFINILQRWRNFFLIRKDRKRKTMCLMFIVIRVLSQNQYFYLTKRCKMQCIKNILCRRIHNRAAILFFHKLIQLPVIWFGEFLTDCRKPVVCYHCHNFIHSYLRTETPRSAR